MHRGRDLLFLGVGHQFSRTGYQHCTERTCLRPNEHSFETNPLNTSAVSWISLRSIVMLASCVIHRPLDFPTYVVGLNTPAEQTGGRTLCMLRSTPEYNTIRTACDRVCWRNAPTHPCTESTAKHQDQSPHILSQCPASDGSATLLYPPRCENSSRARFCCRCGGDNGPE